MRPYILELTFTQGEWLLKSLKYYREVVLSTDPEEGQGARQKGRYLRDVIRSIRVHLKETREEALAARQRNAGLLGYAVSIDEPIVLELIRSACVNGRLKCLLPVADIPWSEMDDDERSAAREFFRKLASDLGEFSVEV